METIEEFKLRFQYTQQSYLDDGSFSNVYKAWDSKQKKYVAVKIVNRTNSEKDRYTLPTEVAIANSIVDKTNIAYYEECFTVNTPTGIADIAVMEYYPNGNLAHFLRVNPIDAGIRDQLIRGIINGLEQIHLTGIIHRDLKPQNILIAAEEGSFVPKISDFGISKKSTETANIDFSNSLVGGTLAYSSPEQLKNGTVKLLHNTDCWSLGIIINEILQGSNLFLAPLRHIEDKDEKRKKLLHNIKKLNINKAVRPVKAPWHDIIKGCLKRSPRKRIPSVIAIQKMIAAHEMMFGDTIISGQRERTIKLRRSVWIGLVSLVVAGMAGLYLYNKKLVPYGYQLPAATPRTFNARDWALQTPIRNNDSINPEEEAIAAVKKNPAGEPLKKTIAARLANYDTGYANFPLYHYRVTKLKAAKKFGVINRDGQIVVPFVYDNVRPDGTNQYVFYKDNDPVRYFSDSLLKKK